MVSIEEQKAHNARMQRAPIQHLRPSLPRRSWIRFENTMAVVIFAGFVGFVVLLLCLMVLFIVAGGTRG